MSFISRGDFMFPLDFMLYWLKHFYTWSYQNGAPNIDGIIRLPSRFLNLFVFAAGGNIAVSYFYLAFSMAIIFGAFYLFAIHVLDIKSRYVRILGSLFFACNPIFLGYIAKIGLIVGAAMLPLCLVVLRLAFTKRQFRYFVLYVLLLNVSFIHPFTLTVNLLVSGLYFLYLLKQDRFVFAHKVRLGGTVLLGLVLNAYFILPIAALGTVSKSALSDEISSTPVDYTSLIDFANAGNPLTAFSLSRNVFLDFQYFSPAYERVYMAAVFVFYLVLLGLYVYNESRLSKPDRQKIALLLGALLVLMLLSMSTFFDINVLIKMLVGLPGGWAFRSPLKWQLYIPFVLAVMLCLLLQRTTVRRIRRGAAVIIVLTVMCMGAFLSVDIYRQLLRPSNFRQLAGLQALDLDRKNMLFINDSACFAFLQQNLEIVTEMNQIFASNNLQVKRVSAANADTINLQSYDYVFGCTAALANPLRDEDGFRRTHLFANDKLALYQNHRPPAYIYAPEHLFALDTVENLADKRMFAARQGQDFDFVHDFTDQPVTGLQDPFEALGLHNIRSDSIVTKFHPVQAGKQTLFASGADNQPTYYRIDGHRVIFSSQPRDGFQSAGDPIGLAGGTKEFEFVYLDQTRYQNLIKNPSFEEGAWQQKVWDCYAYDDQPSIDMRLSDKAAAEGKRSLELVSRNHIACTGTPEIPVGSAERFLLHFRYKSSGPRSYAGYRISFDDIHSTDATDYLPANADDWQTFSREIAVPPGAKTVKLTLYAYPDSEKGGRAAFDDFHLLEIPDIQGAFYVVGQPATALRRPGDVKYQDINPTAKQINVTGAKTPFFLAMRDTYHGLWQAKVGDTPVDSKNHLKLNGFMNGWYIDPAALCRDGQDSCTVRADGSYDLSIDVTFKPQRWFYAGLGISGLGFIGVIGFFAHRGFVYFRQKGYRYWRWQ